MQVSLLSVPNAAFVCDRGDSLYFSASGNSPAALLKGPTEELRDAVRRDEQQKVEAVATLLPTGSAEVINEAERNVAQSSRAFRRQLARQDATEQFREGRQGFRQALTHAKGQDVGTSARQAAPTMRAAESSSTAKSRDGSSSSGTSKACASSATDGTRTSPPADASRLASARAGETGMASTRASADASAARVANGANGPASTARVSSTMGVRAVQGSAAVARVALSATTQATKTGGTGTTKVSGTGPAATNTARAAPKTGGRMTERTVDARSAQNASREANIERIVRVVHQRINAQRSHTVVRLDPPELGSLRLELDLRGFALRLRVETSTEVAHRLLSEDLHKLRDSLEASGIQLERVEIRPPPTTPEAGEQEASQHADSQERAEGESAEPGAEHPEEQGRDSPPAERSSGNSRGAESGPAAESLVNLVA